MSKQIHNVPLLVWKVQQELVRKDSNLLETPDLPAKVHVAEAGKERECPKEMRRDLGKTVLLILHF